MADDLWHGETVTVEEPGPDRGSSAGAAPVSSDALLAELVALRAHEGLTMHKVMELCPRIQETRVVAAEMARMSYARTDAYVAAASVIKCAVRRLILRTDLSRILEVTLNLNGVEEHNLELRRHTLRRSLYLSSKSYGRKELVAYRELAGQLIAAVTSPCAEEQAPEDITVQISVGGEKLVPLLNFLSLESRLPASLDIQDIIWREFPNGERTIRLLEAQEDWQHQSNHTLWVLSSVLQSHWPPRARLSARRRLFDSEVMKDMLDVFGNRQLHMLDHPPSFSKELRDAAQYAESAPATGKYIVRGNLQNRYFSDKLLNLEYLADLLQQVEEANYWGPLLGFPGEFTPAREPWRLTRRRFLSRRRLIRRIQRR